MQTKSKGVMKRPTITKISRKLFDKIEIKSERAFILFELILRYHNKEINNRHLVYYRSQDAEIKHIQIIPVSKHTLNELAKKKLFKTTKDILKATQEIFIEGKQCIQLSNSMDKVRVSNEFRKLSADFTKGYVGHAKDNLKGNNRTERLILAMADHARFAIVKEDKFEDLTGLTRKDKQVAKIMKSAENLGYSAVKNYRYTSKGKELVSITITAPKAEQKQGKANEKPKQTTRQTYRKNDNNRTYPNYTNRVYSCEQSNDIDNLIEELAKSMRINNTIKKL